MGERLKRMDGMKLVKEDMDWKPIGVRTKG